jgi:hypothetical protein
MPALLILAVISWLLGTGKPRAKADALPLFTILELRPKPRWRVFFISAVSHTLCLSLLFLLSDLFSTNNDDEFLVSQAARHALVIKLPEHIYLAPAAGHDFPATARLTRGPRISVQRKDLRKYTEAGSETKSIAPPSDVSAGAQAGLFSMMMPPPLPQAEPRKFELPNLPVCDTAAQTLLQAEAPPNLPPAVDKRLPDLLFWDSDPAKPPKHPIQPGNLTARLEPPKLNSTPRLEPPNQELITSDFRMASRPAAPVSSLPLPPAANTMPVRILDSTQNPTGPTSIDPFTGDPVHVMALSPDPAPLTDALKALFIPAGNQLARLPGSPPLFGFSGLGDGSGDAGGGVGASFSGGEPARGPGDMPNSPELVHSLAGDGRIFGLLSPPGLNGTPLRVLHPAGGVFDVVVVQTSNSEAFSAGADALSGRPIYTVYLQVGAPKEWIMEYCLPNMAGAVQTGGIVNLGNPEPVTAPYPTVTVRPPEDWRHGSDYLLVHGFLDENGRLRDMKILASQNPQEALTDAVLQYLPYWEFRPAVVDGHPVKVEVILAVPPDLAS